MGRGQIDIMVKRYSTNYYGLFIACLIDWLMGEGMDDFRGYANSGFAYQVPRDELLHGWVRATPPPPGTCYGVLPAYGHLIQFTAVAS